MQGAGIFRYLKDAYVFLISFLWPLAFINERGGGGLILFVKYYFIWLLLLVSFGLLGFVFYSTPLFFLISGFRWILLLNAAFGVYILSCINKIDFCKQKYVYNIILIISLLQTVMVAFQLSFASHFMGLQLGAARLTGFFNNAGVASFFAVSITLFCAVLDGISLKKKLFIFLICDFLALASGTRALTIAIFIVIVFHIYEMSHNRSKEVKFLINVLISILFVSSLIVGYQILMSQVDRGDAITQQFEQGGRVSNLISVFSLISSSELLELLFGRGLGVGSNTAITYLSSLGIDPSQYRFNILIDNSFMTSFFQFGLLGSIIFWLGIVFLFFFSRRNIPFENRLVFRCLSMIVLLIIISGSPFEHFYLMMSFSFSLGYLCQFKSI
ncbi:hypothetical protein ACEUDO_19125 [Aeromonas rivipollensis]|uniref:hypothetical protein n=1 Tax=Aeromonas rivipollensis TaxID=948519 RepID=UPI0038E6AE3E